MIKTMDRHEIRYMFEHRLLPHWFFEKKFAFVGMLHQDKGILYRIINDIFEKEGAENPYTVDMFGASLSKITDQAMTVKISFPEPEEEPLCYCSYLFFDEKFEKTGYFCIEKGNTEGGMCPFVCSWTEDGNHRNHGQCGLKNDGDFLRCADIYMEEMYGMTRKKKEKMED